MELETVLYRVEGAVAVVSMNRTKAMNSLNKQIFADLTTAFEAARDDDAVRCVILNAEGRAFCAGGDIAEMKSITTEEAFFDFMTVAGGFTTLLNTFPKPVITDELIDRYGDPPRGVTNLIAIALLRVKAARLGISEIAQKETLRFSLPKPDFQKVAAVCGLEKYRRRLLFSAGDKPHLALRLKKGDDVIKLAGTVLEDYGAAE